MAREKIQYPNPKFWKAKDDINWKKQGENLKESVNALRSRYLLAKIPAAATSAAW